MKRDNTHTLILTCFVLTLLLSACSSDNENSALEGSWQLGCYLDTELPAELDDVYRKVVVTFSGGSTGNFSSTFSGHNSAECAEPAIANESGTLTGTYLIGNELTSADGLAVTELDLMRNTLTPLGLETITPIVDRPLGLDISYINDGILYFGVDDDPDANPPVRATSIDFNRPFVRQ